MYKFTNKTTKEQFLKTVEFNRTVIEKTDKKAEWKIADRYGNVWRVVFVEVNQFTVFNDSEPFWVDIYFKGQTVEILQAMIKGRKFKDERYLKKFAELTMMISCFFQFGYMKLA